METIDLILSDSFIPVLSSKLVLRLKPNTKNFRKIDVTEQNIGQRGLFSRSSTFVVLFQVTILGHHNNQVMYDRNYFQLVLDLWLQAFDGWSYLDYVF